MVDVLVIDETTIETVSFVIDMELVIPTSPAAALPVSYAGKKMTIDEIAAAMQQAIPLALDAESHAVLNTTNYTVNVGIDTDNRFFFNMHRVGVPATQATVQMLFKTGINKTDSMHRVLGFPQENTSIDATTSGVQAVCSINTEPYRFIDIEIGEVPRFKPFARLFISGEADEFKRPLDTPEQVRLLTDPLRRLSRLRIKLILPDNKSPNHEIVTAHDLAFEILSLEPVSCTPNWVNQKLLY
jgi:hypothetical protein